MYTIIGRVKIVLRFIFEMINVGKILACILHKNCTPIFSQHLPSSDQLVLLEDFNANVLCLKQP